MYKRDMEDALWALDSIQELDKILGTKEAIISKKTLDVFLKCEREHYFLWQREGAVKDDINLLMSKMKFGFENEKVARYDGSIIEKSYQELLLEAKEISQKAQIKSVELVAMNEILFANIKGDQMSDKWDNLYDLKQAKPKGKPLKVDEKIEEIIDVLKSEIQARDEQGQEMQANMFDFRRNEGEALSFHLDLHNQNNQFRDGVAYALSLISKSNKKGA